MKLLKTFFILLFFISYAYAEEKESDTKKFSFFIKRGNYLYQPSDYYTSIDAHQLYIFRLLGQKNNLVGDLKNNEKIINPISFTYYSQSIDMFFEYSYYKINLDNPYYYYPTLFFQPQYKLNSITRRESKINAFKQKKISEKNYFYLGMGIRNLFKETYNQDTFSRNSESIDSYGLQLLLKYQLKINDHFEIGLSLEPFYTYGHREQKGRQFEMINYLSSDGLKTGYLYDYRGTNQKAYFYGSEFDFNIGYKISENWKLFLGYNFIFTKIRYENYRNFKISYLDSLHVPSESTFIKNTDHIQSIYLGVKAEF
jgi:outer membrane protein (TIGR04327 family)